MLAALGLVGIGLLIVAVAVLRVDPALRWLGLRLEVWAGMGCALIGFIWWLMLKKKG